MGHPPKAGMRERKTPTGKAGKKKAQLWVIHFFALPGAHAKTE